MFENVLKILGICGAVGAATIAVGEVADNHHKKVELKKLELEEDFENDVQKAVVVPNAMTIDQDKLEQILVQANYPADSVKNFVEAIKKEAAVKPETVEVEIVDKPKAAAFTVVEEKVQAPRFTKTDEHKKPQSTSNKKTTNKK